MNYNLGLPNDESTKVECVGVAERKSVFFSEVFLNKIKILHFYVCLSVVWWLLFIFEEVLQFRNKLFELIFFKINKHFTQNNYFKTQARFSVLIISAILVISLFNNSLFFLRAMIKKMRIENILIKFFCYLPLEDNWKHPSDDFPLRKISINIFFVSTAIFIFLGWWVIKFRAEKNLWNRDQEQKSFYRFAYWNSYRRVESVKFTFSFAPNSLISWLLEAKEAVWQRDGNMKHKIFLKRAEKDNKIARRLP